jgi:O-methyltransferase
MLKKILINLIKSSGVINIKLITLSKFILRQNKIITLDLSRDDRGEIIELIYNTKSNDSMLLTFSEAFNICIAVKATTKVNGNIAEVGVYKGGSARLISEFKGNRKLFLFDTFEGLPELNSFDTSNEFFKGQFKETSLEFVKEILSPFDGINIFKGYFPETAGPIESEKFSFVHLDVDLHKSTVDSLEFFYPRMLKGGIIISHDYINADGVRLAFDNFFKDKPETILTLSETQCMIVKT